MLGSSLLRSGPEFSARRDFFLRQELKGQAMSSAEFHKGVEQAPDFSAREGCRAAVSLFAQPEGRDAKTDSPHAVQLQGVLFGLVWLEIDGSSTGLDWFYAPFVRALFSKRSPMLSAQSQGY